MYPQLASCRRRYFESLRNAEKPCARTINGNGPPVGTIGALESITPLGVIGYQMSVTSVRSGAPVYVPLAEVGRELSTSVTVRRPAPYGPKTV
jgi:hypothetical protein